MKSLLTVLLLCAFVLMTQAQVRAQAQAQVQKNSISVESVQAYFTQEKQLPILARPIISKGRFVFKAPGSLRWEYFSPIRTVLLMDDGHISKFIKRDGKFIEEHGMGVDSMRIILSEITGWLDGDITDTPTFRVQSRDDGFIILTPRDATLAKIISRIELKLLDQSGLMESVTIYEGPGSLTRMMFSATVLNEKGRKIPQESFKKP
jgi:outer membrane lipoprotein-sorting protein